MNESEHHSQTSMYFVLFDCRYVRNEKARLVSGAHLLRRRGRGIRLMQVTSRAKTDVLY